MSFLDMSLDDVGSCRNGSGVGDNFNADGSSPHPCDVEKRPSFVLAADSPAKELPRQRDSLHQEDKGPQEENGGEKAVSPSATWAGTNQECTQTPDICRGLLFHRGLELLQMQTEVDRHTEECGGSLEDMLAPVRPHPTVVRATGEVDLVPHTPSLFGSMARGSFLEERRAKEDAAAGRNTQTHAMTLPPLKQKSQSSSMSRMKASLKVPPHKWTKSFSEQYKNLLLQREEELQKTAEDYERYAVELAKQFKRPPVVLPTHLVNSFADTNVIEAKDHKGRRDIFIKPFSASSRSFNRSEDDFNDGALESLRMHEGEESFLQQRQQKQQQQRKQNPMNAFPQRAVSKVEEEKTSRFTIHSLSNGDLRERDALRGLRYWDSEAPAVRKRVLPSRLLEERTNKAFHKYRFYSHRFGKLLKELAIAIGGEEGVELLRRYETREESLPLPPKCRGDFFESVVDYDMLLREQERIMEAAENNLREYYGYRLDKSPVASQQQSLPLLPH
ncbi:hypothetical protein TcCL_NonESM09634 [Trypanosoma cruzi]|uniref:Uncharacterized protein n=1 Tax=Trypanosoma cruzi (strain CL Brener) TaxID=353153 RepID=Q4D3Z7_TRYCC|nr:hypothetical protein, conserved [Trypanosoma cruzi]EAN87252.1 hypothetical protein, conserved [Trypanosoma cruzi]RNC40843.1 hypothetical protein TcCL_NonESM09634 [Trypanosoma cruzi]|eukprot:XP_809103.1 hypothetical protein [Trypanosoma cruzi strain CL Brener]